VRVGIIGSGDVGRELGAGLARHGHDVMIGSREPRREILLAWAQETGGRTGLPAETAAHGEIVFLATLWSGTQSALSLAGEDALAGKVLIDVTNPLDFSGGSPPTLAVSGDDSGGESVQRWAPKARVVKALNTVTASMMIDPDLHGGPPTMFIAGDDEPARRDVSALLKDVGWEVADLGPLKAARYIEGMAMCWIWYGFATNTWRHAFKLLL
jgi:predicted dinucleotide-binding enzyme